MTQHTPGPWWFDKHANAIVRATVRPDALAQFCEYVGPPDAADLSLMVSAPELLEALEGIEPHLDAIICYASTTGEHEPNLLAANVRAAIKSARGQA